MRTLKDCLFMHLDPCEAYGDDEKDQACSHGTIKESMQQNELHLWELIGSLNGLFTEEYIKTGKASPYLKKVNELIGDYQEKKLKNFGNWGDKL